MDEPTDDDLRNRYLTRLKGELVEIRAASAKTADARKPVELDQQSVGRLSRMDAMQQQAMSAAQEARRMGRIRAIEAATRRFDTGEFGYCCDCGDFIGLQRLDLDPTVVRCLDCAR